MKEIDMEEEFRTIPEVPEDFEEWSYSFFPKIPIYYKRRGKYADCICGKCGKVYTTDQIPVRNESAKCQVCGNEGYYEWQRIQYGERHAEEIELIQCTTEGAVVVRMYIAMLWYRQGAEAKITLTELKRWILKLGDVHKFNNGYTYTKNGYGRAWKQEGESEGCHCDRIYKNWKSEIRKSDLKYFDTEKLLEIAGKDVYSINKALETFANNPAVEMYAKAGMRELVRHLMDKRGKTKLINRRAKTIKGQLRINDKQQINRLVAHKGDPILLEIMQDEKRTGQKYTPEQELFLKRMYGTYDGKKRVGILLHYMTLQQAMNRIEKYRKQEGKTEFGILMEYTDYLNMREELGYDMDNEVYRHPKNLKQKHDQMVKERNERRDELHAAKMMKKYPDIEKRYKKLCKKYEYEAEGYFIRPAKNAEEIINEGRTLHHCVGGENYLSKHNKGETTILFLRKNKDIPYYTIEIKGNTILQWYGIRDSKPNKEIIQPFLDRYVEYLKNGRKLRIAG